MPAPQPGPPRPGSLARRAPTVGAGGDADGRGRSQGGRRLPGVASVDLGVDRAHGHRAAGVAVADLGVDVTGAPITTLESS